MLTASKKSCGKGTKHLIVLKLLLATILSAKLYAMAEP